MHLTLMDVVRDNNNLNASIAKEAYRMEKLKRKLRQQDKRLKKLQTDDMMAR